MLLPKPQACHYGDVVVGALDGGEDGPGEELLTLGGPSRAPSLQALPVAD
jgi:hypothetical protein